MVEEIPGIADIEKAVPAEMPGAGIFGMPEKAYSGRMRRRSEADVTEPLPPLMAQPLMAQPLMAQPLMAQPLMAQPLMAQPLMAQPLIAERLGVLRERPIEATEKGFGSLRGRASAASLAAARLPLAEAGLVFPLLTLRE